MFRGLSDITNFEQGTERTGRRKRTMVTGGWASTLVIAFRH